MSKAPAVDYALRIIEFLANSSDDVGIADICNNLNINKNAISRVLEALSEQNWIYLTDASQKKFRLSMKPFSLSFFNLSTTNETPSKTSNTDATALSLLTEFKVILKQPPPSA